jgi:hypothetical protein
MNREEQHPELSTREDPDEFISSAREYFAGDFPNRERNGCPRRAEVEKSIKSDVLPADDLRQHLFACSECFVLYREILTAHRELKPAHIGFWQRITAFARERPLLVWAPGLAAFLVVIAVPVYIAMRSPQPQNNTSPEQSVSQVRDSGSSPVVTPSPLSPTPVPTQNHPVQESVHVARLDLRDYSPHRGGGGGQDEQSLQIRAGQTLFAITLPEGSPAGSYLVSLLDAFGKTIRTRTVNSRDGKELTTTLNLHNLRDQQYRICVSRTNEPPNCYPILVTRNR